MNRNREMDMHYVDSEFPYAINESFINFFDGLSHAPLNYSQPEPTRSSSCENAQWSMHMQSYKFGISDPESTYYSPYPGNNYLPRTYETSWSYPSMMTTEKPVTANLHAGDQDSTPEESNVDDVNAESSQVCPICNVEVFGEE